MLGTDLSLMLGPFGFVRGYRVWGRCWSAMWPLPLGASGLLVHLSRKTGMHKPVCTAWLQWTRTGGALANPSSPLILLVSPEPTAPLQS